MMVLVVNGRISGLLIEGLDLGLGDCLASWGNDMTVCMVAARNMYPGSYATSHHHPNMVYGPKI